MNIQREAFFQGTKDQLQVKIIQITQLREVKSKNKELVVEEVLMLQSTEP